MTKAPISRSNLLTTRSISARHADSILDHLSVIMREIDRSPGRIERIHGMDLQYWTGRINAVINETAPFSLQQECAKRLMVRLLAADRA